MAQSDEYAIDVYEVMIFLWFFCFPLKQKFRPSNAFHSFVTSIFFDTFQAKENWIVYVSRKIMYIGE